MKKKVARLSKSTQPVVGVIMGSVSDWETMQHAAATLADFGVAFEKQVISGHRTPDTCAEYSKSASRRGLKVIIAAAGGAAHLAGMTAAHTMIPVLGVPMKGWALDGLDSLLATVQMPAGIPVPTLSIGKAGAINAALSAVAILALSDPALRKRLQVFRKKQTRRVLDIKLPD